MAATPESKVKKRVKKVLDEMQVYYFMPVTSGYGNSGVPDVVACIKGKFFGIECKAGNNKPTALQDKHMHNIRESGGAAFVVDETNVDTLHALIHAQLGD